MTVLAGCREEDAKFDCPIDGQVGIELGLIALCFSIVLACDSTRIWRSDKSGINYFWPTDFLSTNQPNFLITIQTFAIVVGTRIMSRLALLSQTERTRGDECSVRATA